MIESANQTQAFLDRFEDVSRRLADQGPDWLRTMRAAGRERFAHTGWPSPREEAWRGTNVSPVTKAAFQPAPRVGDVGGAAHGLVATEFASTRLTFVDGRFAPDRSVLGTLPDGVWVGSLARALGEIPDRVHAALGALGGPSVEANSAHAFQALNNAFLEDGAVVLVPDGCKFDEAVQVTYLSGSAAEPVACHPRTLFVVGNNASGTVIELYGATGDNGSLTNAVSQTIVGDNARAAHYRVQMESEAGYHVSTIASHQGRDSHLDAFNVNLGGKLVRHDVRGCIAGEGSYCNLMGLYLTHGAQHLDNHTTLDHAAANCGSREIYKGILDGRSRTVFTGRIIVRPGSQKTDAKQSNPNLLLSADALAHTRPQLEIYADDVKCTHGATIGQMDADAIFYLRSRGVPADEARNMLVHAFAGEVLEHLEHDALRTALEAAVHTRLTRPDA